VKYPCADGIDRDVFIERYLKLERELAHVSEGIGKLTQQKEAITREMSDIQFNALGGVGHAAMRAGPKP